MVATHSHRRQIRAVAEVFLVRFVLLDLILLAVRAAPGAIAWQENNLSFIYSTGLIFIAVGLGLIALRRRDIGAYGITFANPGYHLGVFGRCLIPVVLAGVPVGMGMDYARWDGALAMAGLQIVLLVVVGALLKHDAPRLPVAAVTASLALLPLTGALPAPAGPARAVSAFVYYAVLVGFGEEILYRGYVQSRLNEAFGRPFCWFGAHWGSGLVIASLLFGLSHVGILGYSLGLAPGLTWAWGFWTFFGGLVFGYVRERTGSILAPALLHGLPQAAITAALAL